MMIGYAFCGSFCTIEQSLSTLEGLVRSGYEVLPIMSETAYSTDTRFGKCQDIKNKIKEITSSEIVHSIVEAEPIGPSLRLDALVISPCTGNTLAKIASGITDGTVCMAAKAHLRSDRPLVIALASNDAMSANLKNIAALMSKKFVYFVPMRQDDPDKKPHSLVAEFDLLPSTLESAMKGKQLRRIFL
ncbi:MAG: dipicolinate synthase subunit B [Clostridia bacterium]|nr:dipicolinate synthase subunit B [Clostridia bacterium]MEE1116574.1 dipicolinate synthase subunit B [Clostridia bacterium]